MTDTANASNPSPAAPAPAAAPTPPPLAPTPSFKPRGEDAAAMARGAHFLAERDRTRATGQPQPRNAESVGGLHEFNDERPAPDHQPWGDLKDHHVADAFRKERYDEDVRNARISAEAQQRREEEAFREQTNAALRFNEAETQVLEQQVQPEWARFQQDLAAHNEKKAIATALLKTNPELAQMAVPQLQAEARQLLQRYAAFQQVGAGIRQTLTEQKPMLADQMRLYREHPELHDPKFKEAGIKWWKENKRELYDAIVNERDLRTVNKGVYEYKDHLKQQAASAAMREVEEYLRWNGFGSNVRVRSIDDVHELQSRPMNSRQGEAIRYVTARMLPNARRAGRI